MMKLPEEIIEARTYLEQAENESDPERQIEQLNRGFRALESYQEDDSEVPDEIVDYVNKLRISHARSLLNNITVNEYIKFDVWFDYMLLFLTRLNDEVSYLVGHDNELKRGYSAFIMLYKDTLKEVIVGTRKVS